MNANAKQVPVGKSRDSKMSKIAYAKKAEARYHELQNEIAELLGEITTGLGRHASETGGRPNWTHVGDMGYYAEPLREVRDSLHKLGEHAVGCNARIEGTQNLCTLDAGHTGDHRCKAGDAERALL